LALESIGAALKPSARAILRFVSKGRRKSLEDVIEDVRRRPRWAEQFAGFRKPYIHFTPEDYRALAEGCGFRVLELRVKDKAWDFKSREGFLAFARATFVEWTRCLPESEWEAFIVEVLEEYRAAVSENDEDANTFKFYQMEVVLVRASAAE
jgi:trans-aconitate 2-methyltransferase